MENLPVLIHEVNQCITKDFAISNPGEAPATFDEIMEKLSRLISYMLDKDFNRLLNIFYRLDLDEKKVTAILNQEAPDKIARKLAELVIERELKKAATRIEYRNKG